ncbi:MAG: hypothetical protein M0R74_01330 [Dehalococcoidia bacterium]|nr:hypothetical protein [Dehalococcoidia bacterium]
MARWQDIERAAPAVAEGGQQLLYQFGIGLGYLATVGPDGTPRVHPFCPIIEGGGLYGFIVPSPKRRDLYRSGRFAIHSFPMEDRDDEFFCSGAAQRELDASTNERVLAKYRADGGDSSPGEELFEFEPERALLARYKARGEPDNWPPDYLRWMAAAN